MTIRSALSLTAALAVLLVGAAPASAMSCSISAITGIAFGTYDVFGGAPLDSTGSITYACDNVGESDVIAIELSPGGASTYFPRSLSHSVHRLDYNLYQDPSHTLVWGDGTSGTGRYQQLAPPEGSSTTIPVYARIGARQNAHVGVYGDVVVATVIF